MTFSIFESIRFPTSLFPKKPGTNENLRRTNLHDLIFMTERTQQVYISSSPSFLTSILLGRGFLLVGGCLEIDLWQVHLKPGLYIKSLHFILAQSGTSLIAAACPLKSI